MRHAAVYAAIALVLSLVGADPVLAQNGSVAPLMKPQAASIVSKVLQQRKELNASCYPVTVVDLRVKGKWATAFTRCRTFEDAVINAVLAYRSGRWVFACSHGDDVMYAEQAEKKCGMTHAQATALGFPDSPNGTP